MTTIVLGVAAWIALAILNAWLIGWLDGHSGDDGDAGVLFVCALIAPLAAPVLLGFVAYRIGVHRGRR